MNFFVFFKQILQELWREKLRSFLALFGIVWGTLTVILLLPLGSGFQTAMRTDVMQLADGTLFMIPGQTTKIFRGMPKGRSIKVKSNAVMEVKEVVPGIERISPALMTDTQIVYRNKMFDTTVYGTAPDAQQIRKVKISQSGRFFNQVDVDAGRRVTVLGDKLKRELFGSGEAVGRSVLINRVPFVVVGVIQNADDNVYNWYDEMALIPYTTFISVWGNNDVTYFFILPDPSFDASQVKQSVINYFASRFRFSPQDDSAIRVVDTTKFFNFVKWFFIGIELFLGACGVLTLAIGCLGVANILYLIVSERTREIGLRMAVGATERRILLRMMSEGFLMILIGGGLGFLLAFLIAEILKMMPLPYWLGTPHISLSVSAATILILSLFAFVTSFFPARRACKMDPVEALRC